MTRRVAVACALFGLWGCGSDDEPAASPVVVLYGEPAETETVAAATEGAPEAPAADDESPTEE